VAERERERERKLRLGMKAGRAMRPMFVLNLPLRCTILFDRMRLLLNVMCGMSRQV